MNPGERIGQYEVLGAVGRGGMGVVYKARDTRLDRVVALKFLPPEASRDAHAKERFYREARSASALDHPNICTIHDIDETDDGRLYIVMAYYDGRTLRQRLETETFTLERSLAIGRQLASALETAHRAGIVHRDLKPANVMIGDQGEVKLLDFGVAKLTTDEDLTATQGAVGTIAYMSPEQLHGETVDGRSDVWALGVLLYEMLGGRRPFDGASTAAAVTSILQQTPAPIGTLRPEIPSDVAAWIDRCLQKDRDRRPASSAELERGLAREETTSPGDSTRTIAVKIEPRRSRLPLAVAFALPAVLVMAVLGFWLLPREPADEAAGFSSDLLAVFPFTVRGDPELAYLGEGMVDLMSARLDGIGGVETIDPRVVVSRIRADGLDVSNPGTSAQLASRLGARRYVTGELLEIAGRITLTAYLHDAASNASEKATVEGDAATVFDLVDGLVADLVANSLSSPLDRLGKSAAMTSHSLEATKEYLRGEQYLRAGRYRDAADAYEAAVEADPEFALAHYRKSVAADWIDAYDVRSSAEKALEHADRLPPRDRDLLEALTLRRLGQNDAAEQAYRAILHRHPNDVEALIQLGETLFHDSPRIGRDMLESAIPFSRVLELEPANSIARIHLARLQALRGEIEALRETAEVFARTSPESERALEVEALYAFSVDDPELQARVIERLETKSALHVFYAAHGTARFARATAGAERILEASADQSLLISALRLSAHLEHGRLEDFNQLLGRIPDSDSATWDQYRAFLLTSGTVRRDPARMESVLERLRDVTPEAIRSSSWLPPYEDMTLELFAFGHDFNLAMLLIQLDRIDEARELIGRLEQAGPFHGVGTLQRDKLWALEAEILYRGGDEPGALEALREIKYEVPHAVTVLAFAEGSRSRFLRAELERRVGDLETARGFYRGLDESWAWWDTGFRPRVYRGLAEIAVAQGRPQDAARDYARLLELWENCDPAFHAERDAVQAALDAL